MKSFRIMGRVLKATYEELFLCVMMSALWWVGQILIITAAPATMGMHAAANQIANYRRTGSEFFWDGAKRNIGRGWLMYALLLITPILIFINAWFYLNVESWLRVFAFMWLWVLIFILMAGQYVIPLFFQQDEPSVKLALRNAALLALRFPLYSILLAVFQVLFVTLSFVLVLPLVILAPAMLALSGELGLVGVLQEMGLAPPPPESAPRD